MAIIFTDDIPSIVPLSAEQKLQGVSGILPSGESNFFDHSQLHSLNDGSGINSKYPSPENISGEIYKTYPSNSIVDPNRESGILNYNELNGSFSNANKSSELQVSDFNIFNPYIHYYSNIGKSYEGDAIKIPYISSYRIAIVFDPYTPRNL